MMKSLEGFVGTMLSEEQWPFWAVALVFMVIGHFSTTKVFTRQRAYQKRKKVWLRWLLFWGRESLMLHPILAGLALGYLAWVDPLGRDWTPIASAFYFGASGFVSMILWLVIRGIAKARGIELRLPGESEPPPEK